MSMKSKVPKSLEKAWKYVGRFMWRFSGIESNVSEIFVSLFDLNSVAALMFIGNLDLRKKMKLIDLGLKHQGIDKDCARAA